VCLLALKILVGVEQSGLSGGQVALSLLDGGLIRRGVNFEKRIARVHCGTLREKRLGEQAGHLRRPAGDCKYFTPRGIKSRRASPMKR